jgi:hypothetical protein
MPRRLAFRRGQSSLRRRRPPRQGARVCYRARLGGSLGAVVVGILDAQGHRVDWGDAPTWLAVIVASLGGYVALRQLRNQEQDLKRQTLQLERQQAERVNLERYGGDALILDVDRTSSAWPSVVLAVDNQSRRPIRHVRCQIRSRSGSGVWEAEACGYMTPSSMEDQVARSHLSTQLRNLWRRSSQENGTDSCSHTSLITAPTSST